MPRSVEIKLSLPIVLPLLELIRDHATAFEGEYRRLDQGPASGQAGSPPESSHLQTHLADVRTFLALFNDDFSKTGAITFSEKTAHPGLRACTLLRVRIRREQLAAITDATLETGLKPDAYTGAEHRSVMCYCFLATIQTLLIQNFPPTRGTGRSATLWTGIRGFLRPRRSRPTGSSMPTPDAVSESCQVAVLNDPVNLMEYVTAVFQIVIGLPTDVAQQRMQEVHEAKSSIVWEGAQEKAEAYASEIRLWHLNAVVRPAEAK